MSQETAKTETEAKRLLDEAESKGIDFLGGRVIAPSRGQRKAWFVQAYYADPGGTPPQGMARLSIPSNAPGEYGIEAA